MNSYIFSASIKPEKKEDLVEFVYKKDSGETSWRKIDLAFEDSNLVKGYDKQDANNYKTFKKSHIIGRRLLRLPNAKN